MLIANALLRVLLAVGVSREAAREEVASLFLDWPVDSASFSLQNFVAMGAAAGIRAPGEWYGPHEASHVLLRLATRYPHALQLPSWPPASASPSRAAEDGRPARSVAPASLRLVVCGDGLVVQSEVRAAAALAGGSPGGDCATPWAQPVLGIIPLRLGLRGVSRALAPQLVAACRLPCFAGAVGGSPRHSLFIVGVRDPAQLLCLDPHTTQEGPPLPAPTPAAEGCGGAPVQRGSSEDPGPRAAGGSSAEESCSPRAAHLVPPAFLRSMEPPDAPAWVSVDGLDPTIALAFLWLSEAEFDTWVRQVSWGALRVHATALFRHPNASRVAGGGSVRTRAGLTTTAAAAPATPPVGRPIREHHRRQTSRV